MESLRAVVEREKPTRLVIDSLSEIRSLARDNHWYRRQILLLKMWFANRQCTVLLLDHLAGTQQGLRTIVSGVVELQQLSPAYGPDRRRLHVAKMRAQSFRSGYHDFKIGTGGLLVYPRLVAAEHSRHFEPKFVTSGVPELDSLLGGGLDMGTATLLLGATGTGKSLTATQYVVAAAERGERSTMYVFDERLQTLFQRAEGVGLQLQRHVEGGMIDVRQIDPAELTPGEFSLDVCDTSLGARLVVVDSLNGYVHAMTDERFLLVHLHELLSCLNQQGVTTLLIMTQHGLVGALDGLGLEISYIADTILLFRHFEYAGAVRTALSVHKRRAGPHERTIRELRITSAGMSVGAPLKDFQGILTGTPQFLGKTLSRKRADE
jgi:circadian clock protein KaiC